jgi:hypothetical protein
MRALKPAITGLLNRIGRRGSFLLFLSLLDFIYGYSLLFPTPRSLTNPTTQFIIEIAPLTIWGVLWLAVGVICLIFAFRRKDTIGFAAAMFLKVLWGFTFLIGWLLGAVERGFLSSAIWLAFAAALAVIAGWPEPNFDQGADQWTRQS